MERAAGKGDTHYPCARPLPSRVPKPATHYQMTPQITMRLPVGQIEAGGAALSFAAVVIAPLGAFRLKYQKIMGLLDTMHGHQGVSWC